MRRPAERSALLVTPFSKPHEFTSKSNGSRLSTPQLDLPLPGRRIQMGLRLSVSATGR